MCLTGKDKEETSDQEPFNELTEEEQDTKIINLWGKLRKVANSQMMRSNLDSINNLPKEKKF